MQTFLGEKESIHAHESPSQSGAEPGGEEDHRPPLRALAYHLRTALGTDLAEESTLKGGFSFATGRSPSLPQVESDLFGVDAKFFYRPLNHYRGFPFFLLQGEAVMRILLRSSGDGAVRKPSRQYDRGGYLELLYGIVRPYVLGVRFERAWQVGSISEPDHEEPLPSRTRISPLLLLTPTEFSRLRLQYNLDILAGEEHRGIFHTLWLGVEVLLGKHPAHLF